MQIHRSADRFRAGGGVAAGRGRGRTAVPAVLLALALLLPAASAGAAAVARVSPAVEIRLPADIVYSRAPGADSAVTFSHRTHVALAGNRCTGCHPATFPMLKRGTRPDHAAMGAGRSCGACHDGKQAFGVRDSSACGTCHVAAAARAVAGGAVARARPAPHRYPKSPDSPGRVTFRHESHVRGGVSCTACHPKLFRMTAAAPLAGGGMHARGACGACHDGTKAFAAEDGASCARCHVEEAGR